MAGTKEERWMGRELEVITRRFTNDRHEQEMTSRMI